jgi:hypothetical protein
VIANQSKAATEAKEERVRGALRDAVETGADITIRGIARTAGVDHTFIQRRDHLRTMINAQRGMDRDDVLDTVGGIVLTPRQRTIIDQARGSEPLARYTREALLEKAARDLGCSLEDLEELDTARRPAPRRQNRQQQREDA